MPAGIRTSPIAGILLGVGSRNFNWLPAVVSHVMAGSGRICFANMPLIFRYRRGVGLHQQRRRFGSVRRWPAAMASWCENHGCVAPLVLHLPAVKDRR